MKKKKLVDSKKKKKIQNFCITFEPVDLQGTDFVQKSQ